MFHLLNEMKRADLNVWIQFSYFFDYVPVFSKISHQALRHERALNSHMVRESRRFSDESWQESRGDPMACGYGAGAGTSVVNAGFNRDSREGGVSVWRDEDETWADVHAPLPDVRQLVQRHCHPRTNRRPSPPCCSKSL